MYQRKVKVVLSNGNLSEVTILDCFPDISCYLVRDNDWKCSVIKAEDIATIMPMDELPFENDIPYKRPNPIDKYINILKTVEKLIPAFIQMMEEAKIATEQVEQED